MLNMLLVTYFSWLINSSVEIFHLLKFRQVLQILSLFINKLFAFQIIDNLTLKKLRNNDFFRVFRFKKLSFYPTEITRLYQAAHFGNSFNMGYIIKKYFDN